MTEPGYDGLLHLGSLAVIITAGYLGIDRLRTDRQTLSDELQRIKTEVKAMLDALQLPAQELIDLPKAYHTHPMYVLCYVAQVRICRVPIQSRIWGFFCRLRHVPLLRYFRAGFDRKIMGIFAVVSLLAYLILTMATVWHLNWLSNEWVLTGIFCLFTIIILWVFITASIALLKLRQLGHICMSLKATVMAEFQGYAMIDFTKAQTTLRTFVLDGSAPPPPPPATPSTPPNGTTI